MTFSLIALIAALAACGLGLGFLFAGPFMLKQWGLETPLAAAVLSRRTGAIYLGIAALLFLIRSDPATQAANAVSIGLATAIGLLAILGLTELKSGRVSAGILVAVTVEVLLTAGFLSTLWA